MNLLKKKNRKEKRVETENGRKEERKEEDHCTRNGNEGRTQEEGEKEEGSE